MNAGESVVYLNGSYVPAEQAVVSVFDHGFLYGDGIFETLVAVEGRVVALDAHLDRLFRSAATIKLAVRARARSCARRCSRPSAGIA